VAFVVNARSELPPIALVLHGAGEGALVAEGPISDAIFEKFKDTKGIIFDMRGYPRGTAWAIAPRINTKGGDRRRGLSAPDRRHEQSFVRVVSLPPADPGSRRQAVVPGQDGYADR
jgi:hypothetical protein